jgi:hypothetical protein
MRRIQTILAATCATLALAAVTATAQTSPSDRTTYVTFSGPVSLPGMTLPAGTYTFRLLDSQTDRHIVQVFDREGAKLMTTLLAVPAERREATGDPVITFKETPADRPPAVHYWYYAGDLAGNELVYPKSQAILIANASGEPVMAVESDSPSIEEWKKGNVSRVMPTSQSATSSTSSASTTTASTTSTSTATTTAEQPPQPTTPPPTTTQPTTTAPAPTPTTTPTTTAPTTAPMDQTAQPSTPPATTVPTTAPTTPVGTSGTLPKTASELPLVGLIGLLALGGAIALRAARTA